jgi:hypothetical protein
VIVVASHDHDDHATAVLDHLYRSGIEVALVDTGQFPRHSRLTQEFAGGGQWAVLESAGGVIDMEATQVVWWRRPQPYGLDPDMDPGMVPFALSEAHEAMAGMWRSLEATWVNPPDLDETAHHKPYQLAVAGRVGLPIPDTVITNDPARARAFIERWGPGETAYKTFLATESHWRETRTLRDEEVDLLDQVELAPVIFQQRVHAVADLRVTVFGEDLFATEITKSPGGYELDYRVDLGRAEFRPTTLPSTVEDGLRRLLARLGLVYGAIDLLKTADGEYVFLEVNPAGEWRFVEERSGQPMTAAMAALLTRLHQEGR